jgi:hypothetical protein
MDNKRFCPADSNPISSRKPLKINLEDHKFSVFQCVGKPSAFYDMFSQKPNLHRTLYQGENYFIQTVEHCR